MGTLLKIFSFVWPLLAVGTGVTVLTQVTKRAARVEKSSVARTLFHTVTFLATLATWWVDHAMSAYMLLLHGGAYGGFANGLYPVVKWVDGKVRSFYNAVKLAKKYAPDLEKIAQDVEETTGVDLGVPETAAAPATPEPTQNTNTAPTEADF